MLAWIDPVVWEELKQAYESRDLVVFAGAGVSAAGGLPTWSALAERLLQRMRAMTVLAGAVEEVDDNLRKGKLLDAISGAQNALGAIPFGDFVAKELDDKGKEVPLLAKAIAALVPRTRGVITTNLDRFLERAHEGTLNDFVDPVGELGQLQNFLWKVHGTIQNRNTWIFARADFERVMFGDARYESTFDALYRARKLLFIGCDLSDDDLGLTLGKVRALAGSQPPTHFAVMEGPIWPQRKRTLEHAGVRLLLYPRGEHDEVVELLRALADSSGALAHSAARGHTAVLLSLDRATETVENAVVKAALDDGNAHVLKGRFEEARQAYLRAQAEAEKQGAENEKYGDKWRLWAARAALGTAICWVNLQEPEEARAILRKISLDALDPPRRLRVANLWATLGDGDTASAILCALPSLSEDLQSEARDVEQRLELIAGRVPPPETLSSSPGIALLAAHVLGARHEAGRAAEIAYSVLCGEDDLPLIRAQALSTAVTALAATVNELSPELRRIPRDARERVTTAIEAHGPLLLDAILPASIRRSLVRALCVFFTLTGDDDGLERVTGESETGEIEEADERAEPILATIRTAGLHAEQGNADAAIAALPENPHPWTTRLTRVDLLRLAGQHERALAECLVLVRDFPGRAPIERTASQLLSMYGRHGEALDHARVALEELPARGSRRRTAECLLAVGRADEAYGLLQKDEERAGPRVLRALAIASDRAHPGNALGHWQRYVPMRPRDGEARVHLAQLLFADHRTEEAASSAWATFEELQESLSPRVLYAIGTLQRILAPGAERDRRLYAVVATLKRRFPQDANAEQARLSLATSTSDFAPDDPIDYDLLQDAGTVRRMSMTDVLGMQQAQGEFSRNVAELGRTGALPIALLCKNVAPPLRVPLLVTRILQRRRAPLLFSAPVGLADAPSGFQIDGGQLLLSEVELYLLGELKLLSAVREKLGARGRVYLLADAWMKITEDFGALNQAAEDDAQKQLDEKVAALGRIPRLSPGAGEEALTDTEIALARGGTILNSVPDNELRAAAGLRVEEIPEHRRISPRTMLRILREKGQLPATTVEAVAKYYEHDPETAAPDSPPKLLLASVFFLTVMWEEKVLDELLSAFPMIHIGNRDWHSLLVQQMEAVESKNAARLAEEVHAWVAEGKRAGWLKIVPDPQPEGLPRLCEPDNVIARQLVAEPLAWCAQYADTLANHSTWWRVVADFFGSTVPLAPFMVSHLAWNDREKEVRTLARRLMTGSKRHITLPSLVRVLLSSPADKKRHETLRRLAELGFPDALGLDEILALAQGYGGLEGVIPRRVLEHLEWMAREPGHVGGDVARLRLIDVYASAVFRAFCGAPTTSLQDLDNDSTGDGDAMPAAVAESFCRVLLGGAERIAQQTRTDFLDSVMRSIGLLAASAPRLSWGRDRERAGISRRDDGPLRAAWQFLRAWAGADGARRSALDRGIREAWLALDGQDNTRLQIASAALDQMTEARHPRGELRLTNLAAEAEVILSAVWAMRPTTMAAVGFSGADLSKETSVSWEDLLLAGARAGKDLEVDRDGRFVAYPFQVPGGANSMLVFAPAEAILLRQQTEEARRFAGFLKRVQGPNDGRAYRLLARLERHPTGERVRHALARRAVSALWRDVRDDPAYLLHWPRSRSLAIGAAHPSLRELRQILSEPPVLEAFEGHPGTILFGRLQHSCWKCREDRWELFRTACEVPGALSFGPIRSMLAQQYESHIEEAISILSHPEDAPVARIARSILLLRAGAAQAPIVTLPSGDSTDLRESLPQLLRGVLEHVTATTTTTVMPAEDEEPPSTGTQRIAPPTMAGGEARLLRICGQVVRDLAAGTPLSVREGLWLTYRLFQWLCRQLEALSADARTAGMERLLAAAPLPEAQPPRDRLDPFGFDRDRFDHRLAAVLYALAAMEELGPILDEGAAGPLHLVWQPAMVDTLMELAARPDENRGLKSELDWGAPDNVADLALVALLRLDVAAFGRLPPEARLRRIRRLPANPEAMDRADQSLFLPLVTAVAIAPHILSGEERTELVTKIRATPRGSIADTWRLLILPTIFGSGNPIVDEEEALAALRGKLDALASPLALTHVLVGVARSDTSRMETVVDEVIAEAERRGLDPVPLAAGVGRVFLFVDEPVREVVLKLLDKLSTRPPFQGDERMEELLIAFATKK